MNADPLRVLIVDDDADTARMMKVLLKREGHEAKYAFDGSGAIEAATGFKPDAVLLDLTLPDMSGSEVAERLRGISKLSGCVLVAVSGYDAEKLGASSPFEHHFTKPVDHEALLNFLSGLRASRQPDAAPA